jgi:hypothetical protein
MLKGKCRGLFEFNDLRLGVTVRLLLLVGLLTRYFNFLFIVKNREEM